MDFLWLNSYLITEASYFDDILNWEDAIEMAYLDMTPLAFLLNSSFASSWVYTDSPVKAAIFDIFYSHVTVRYVPHVQFLNHVLLDLDLYARSFLSDNMFASVADFQNTTITFALFRADTLLINYVSTWSYLVTNSFNWVVYSVYDLFFDSPTSAIFEALDSIILFYVFICGLIVALHFFSVQPLISNTTAIVTRFLLYWASLTLELRIQFEAMLYIAFMFLTYFIFAIMVWDDATSEEIELLHTTFFGLFVLAIAHLLFKYSIHYYSFLEASDVSGRSVWIILKQFFRDVMGSIGLFLRFFTLMFRLNVYDNLDDLYDSYYIFLGDFDDEDFFSELLIPASFVTSFAIDANTDTSYLCDGESDLLTDLFIATFHLFSKFFFFLFFLVEEALRVGLALYISYLITFEVHAVATAYLETQYFLRKRFVRKL